MTLEEIEILKNKKFLNPKELKKIYGFSIDNQAKMRSDRKIPFCKIGRYIRYDISKIDEWIVANGVEMK